MNATYIDTSVLGAYYCPEPLSMAAEKILLSIDTALISMLTEVELMSVIAKKKRAGDFGDAKAKKIIAQFEKQLSDGHYQIAAITSKHYVEAKEILRGSKHNLHTVDAIHLAVAKETQSTLATADHAMAVGAKRLGIKVTLVE